MSEIAKNYMQSILGQQTPLEIDIVSESYENEFFLRLLQVDSLWNLGKADAATALLSKIVLKVDDQPKQLQYFSQGLQALLRGDLQISYDSFVQASNDASANQRYLETVFYGERAVNIAFWMACSGKMLQATETFQTSKTTVPFAGGILAFAQYMNDQVDIAETTAREAILAGFNDPWTVHAVAHCLYSQGKSLECVTFLDEYRDHIHRCNPSTFMKGHMEFHQALCYIDLEEESKLAQLIRGPLWKKMSPSEQRDYWNAVGLLNVHWKAELRGMKRDDTAADTQSTIQEALDLLQPTAVPGKSAVFSLCILRWSTGTFRNGWKKQLLSSDNRVLVAMTQAVDELYTSDDDDSSCGFPQFSNDACSKAIDHIAPISNDLIKLGASPEQREVLEDFVGVVAKRAHDRSGGEGRMAIDIEQWAIRNERPNVAFYDTILGKRKIK